MIAQGIGYVQTANQSPVVWAMSALTLASGVFLLAGLITPLVSVFVAVDGISLALSWIPSPGVVIFDSHLAIINLIVVSVAITLLGPGAFSLDARMFGRREITIPSNSRVSEP